MASIYVSYSRSDVPSTVWRVVEQLVEYYGDRAVQGSPPSGSDIEDNVAQSALVVAVIGPRWSTLSGDDLILISRELEAAFGERIPIVPVVVEGATWPPQGDLPGVLKKIAAISAPKVGDETFDDDMQRLIALLDLLLQTSAAPPVEAEASPEAAPPVGAEPAAAALPEAAQPSQPESRSKWLPWRLWRRSRQRPDSSSAPPTPPRPETGPDHAGESADNQQDAEQITTDGNAALDSSAPDPGAAAPGPTEGGEVEPRGRMDTVEFGASYPQGVQLGVPFVVDAWVFPQELRETALRRAVEPDAAARRTAGAAAGRRGSRLTVTLDLAPWEVEPRSQNILWNGTIANVSFTVLPTGGLPGGKTVGTCSFFINGLRIGQASFEPALTPVTLDERHVAQGVAVRNAFASYASQDQRRVLARVRGMEKLGVKVFMGPRNRKANDPYPLYLLKHIDDSDVLYLFWSRDAEESEWVEREWRYGKARKGVEFIDPVPLIDPRLVPPPEELGQRSRFNDWVSGYLEAEKRANAWRRFVAWAAGDH